MKTSAQTNKKAVLAARAEASAWITQLHGPNRSSDMEAGFRRWLGERPENAQEFEGLTEVWDLVSGGAQTQGVPRLERWEQSAEAAELQALRHQRRKSRSHAPQLWARAALVLLTCGIVAMGAYLWSSTAYTTSVGEQRIMRLADGTRVSLNSNSRLVVEFSKSERRLYLKRGEALFEVAKDSLRPLSVIAGDRKITALGTSFVVFHESGRTAVTLMEGKVAVVRVTSALVSSGSRDFEKSQAKAVILNPGQRLVVATSAVPKLDTPRIEAVTAWRRGEVVLNDTALAEAVAEMNRYDTTSIVIDDPEISNLIVSGLYHTGDSEGFAHSVAKMYRLRLVEDEGRIHLRK